MDILAEVLKSVYLNGSVYSRTEFSSPWAVKVKKFGNTNQRIMIFYILEKGNFFLRLDNSDEIIEINQGDLLLFSDKDTHIISSSKDNMHNNLLEINNHDVLNKNVKIGNFSDDESAQTIIMWGVFKFEDNKTNPLLNSLPKYIYLKDIYNENNFTALNKNIKSIIEEMRQDLPGKDVMLDKLSDILLLQFLRIYLLQKSEKVDTSWLKSLSDKDIFKAIQFIHENLEKNITADILAKKIGISRALLFQKFKKLVGEGPIQYLTRWRINKACDILKKSDLNISSIALIVGYQSEASFIHSFKKWIGETPTQFRKNSNDT